MYIYMYIYIHMEIYSYTTSTGRVHRNIHLHICTTYITAHYLFPNDPEDLTLNFFRVYPSTFMNHRFHPISPSYYPAW